MKYEQYEIDHINKLRKLSSECTVLLKSDGSFPLKEKDKIALYGSGVRHTIKGGTGSGDVNTKHFVNVEEGFKNAGFEITSSEWLDSYDKVLEDAHKEFVSSVQKDLFLGKLDMMALIGISMSEPEYSIPITCTAETALYVLSRNSGEGADRLNEKGDALLTDAEVRDILSIASQYKRFMLVLNTGGVVDLSPVLDKVDNILLLSQLGMTTGDTLCDIILGSSYPSGKLTTTWAKTDDYPKLGTFGEMDDSDYKEGIYVGYRYFDSVDKKPLFPFGYGLSYTTFKYSDYSTKVNGENVEISLKVKNTGSFKGKEIVEVYVSKPSVKLDQPYQSLAAFKKTKELEKGEEEIITISFPFSSLSSFDNEKAENVLEEGEYILRVGSSSRDTVAIASLLLDKRTVVEKVSHVGGKPDFEDWKPERRKEEALNIPRLIIKSEDIPQYVASKREVSPKAKEIVSTLTDDEKLYLCVGGFKDKTSISMIGNASFHVAGAAGETTSNLVDKGIPYLIMADGPAGLRLNREYGEDEDGVYSIEEDAIHKRILEFIPKEQYEKIAASALDDKKERHGTIKEQNCTAIPIGTAIAQSFNVELSETLGDIVGEEMEMFGVNIWLAPALNIHRNILCGRNFEYYSEDPLVSGKIASGITRGVQKHKGCGVTIKHFVCNNQETNRTRSSSNVSERALREMYLKGFEITVKESDPYAVMTSYNLLNGVHTSERVDLVETVLRDEWGYDSFVMTDWVIEFPLNEEDKNKYRGASAVSILLSGNDMMMPGSKGDWERMREGVNKGLVSKERLDKSATRIVDAILKLKG